MIFSGSLKVVVNLAAQTAACSEAEIDAPGATLSPDDVSSPGADLFRRALPLVEQIRGCLAHGNTSAQEQRLASWGY